MDIINRESKIKIQKIAIDGVRCEVDMLRLDLIHPVISGNKWFKLKYNIEHALKNGYSSLLTFGGAYSNHLIATAAAAKESGLESIGIVRGHHAKENFTPTLLQCRSLGMQLHFISREAYKVKEKSGEWSSQFPEACIIPEGGSNELGRKGAEEITSYITKSYTHVAVSVGSGTTFAGLRNALPETVALLGFAPMKKGAYLADELSPGKTNWLLTDEYHFGGFGKWNEKLIAFMNTFYERHHIPLDIVYTSKMMYGLQAQLLERHFPDDAKILCIHTGGLQGNASISELLCY